MFCGAELIYGDSRKDAVRQGIIEPPEGEQVQTAGEEGPPEPSGPSAAEEREQKPEEPPAPGGPSAAVESFYRASDERRVPPQGATITTRKQVRVVKYGGYHQRTVYSDMLRRLKTPTSNDTFGTRKRGSSNVTQQERDVLLS